MTSSLGRRRHRVLGEDERRLWEKVAESVEPLHPLARAESPLEAPIAPIAPPAATRPSPAAPLAKPTAAKSTPAKPTIVRPTGPTHRAAGPPRSAVIHVKHAERLDGLAPAVTAPPSLARLDHRTKRRLVRGVIAIDERLDLHGHTQDAAHAILRGFLVTARARGARIVLVITGKGRSGSSGEIHDRGVLRRAVPHWLGDPGLRDVVVGFEEAHLAHGGAGAIYVRLRRPRGPGESER